MLNFDVILLSAHGVLSVAKNIDYQAIMPYFSKNIIH
jgi:hypothetical protein